MATRVIKLREAEEPAPEMVQEVLSQSKRPEVGRFLLQVDRQTKRSYATAEAAEAAGMVIKKNHPLVRVSVYDSVETANKIIELPQGRLRRPKPVAALSAFLVERLTTDPLSPAPSPAPCAPLASPAALSPAP